MNTRLFNRLYPSIASVMYIIFLITDTGIVNVTYSTYIKYSSIILCWIAALYITVVHRIYIIGITMTLTLFADTFLLLLNRHYIIGVTSFAIVQTIYALYIAYKAAHYDVRIRPGRHSSQDSATVSDTHGKPFIYAIYIIPRIIIYILSVYILSHFCNIDSVALISMWSYINLLINVLQAFHTVSYDRMLRLFTAGLVLFFCCDTCVGLVNMSSYASDLIPASALPVLSYLIWVFYLPSQVLIVLHFSKLKPDTCQPNTAAIDSVSTRTDTINRHETGSHNTEVHITAIRPSRFFSVILSVLTALFILSASVSAPILIRPFYYIQIDMRELDTATGYSKDTIREAYDDMVDYCIGINREFDTGELPWSESGKSHFTDVRELFILDISVMLTTGIPLLMYVIYRKKTGYTPYKFKEHSPSFYGSIGLLAVFIIIGALCAADFDRAFVVFHRIFFPGKSNWIFEPDTDSIIRVLPEEFFASCGALILVVLIILCTSFIIKSLKDKSRQ